MKIAVVGAGIVGVTTAYELTLDGHDVTVFEKNTSVAELGSFATGGLMAASLIQPFSHTTWPQSGTWLRLLGNGPSLPRNVLLNAAAYRWWLAWRKARTPEQFQHHFSANAGLLNDSITRLAHICDREKIEFEQSAGQLALLQSGSDLKVLAAKFAALKALGIAHTMLSAEEIANVEPGLRHSSKMHSAAFFPDDGVGNCRQFAQILKERTLDAGAKFVFGTAVTAVKHGPRIALGLSGLPTTSAFDGVVFCTGGALRELAALSQAKVPLVEAHAYSLSAHLREPLNGPRSTVFDLQTQTGISRIGNRIRASGGAHIGRPSVRSAKKAQEHLYRAIQGNFPGAATLSNSTQFWSGTTLVSADAMPVIGETELPGIYLNVGHGFNGWGMACGSARLLAQSVGSTATAKQASGFSPKRFAH